MYRKLVWCYVLILTLLDISLNNKLSAQGKSHGVTVHDSLIEGITFQEWGKEAAGEGGGRALAPGVLALSPAALDFGEAALGAPHVLTVTLTNTANSTLHLASVAGTTPDFHASFFDAKTLPPRANTSFSVVFLGRREGPVVAHLYIHTSLGVHKYPVAGVGVGSAWGVWPLVGVRVPRNASLAPLLALHNPTARAVHVREVASSAAWLGLQLPDGAAAAPRAAWTVPPRASAPLVRLRLAPAGALPATAYVRIKGDLPGGALVLSVEAHAAPPGEYAAPLQLRLRPRGSLDAPLAVPLSAGNSASARVPLEARVWGARCLAAPHSPAPPPPLAALNGNGVKPEGVHVTLERAFLEPHQPLTRAALVSFDYAAMWAGAGAAAGAGGAYCGGWVCVGRAAVPYSVRLLPGTLRLLPHHLHFVSAAGEEARRVREVRVRNEFQVAVQVARVHLAPALAQHFEVQSAAPRTLPPGAEAVVARVRWLGAEGAAGVAGAEGAHLVLTTDLAEYTLPLLVYSGRFDIEWEWPSWGENTLSLGTLGASSTRHVRAALRNPGPVPLCVRELRVSLAGARLALAEEAGGGGEAGEGGAGEACAARGEALAARLTVVAPARAGPALHWLEVHAAPPARLAPPAAPPARLRLELDVQPGRVHALPLAFPPAAPYAWSWAPLTLESTMALPLRLRAVSLPPDNPALSFTALEEGAEVSEGVESAEGVRLTVGTVVYAPERLCAPHCYTGLDMDTAEGAAWAARALAPTAEALRQDGALRAERLALWARAGEGEGAGAANVSLHVHTERVVQLPAAGGVSAWWPRLAPAAVDAGLAAVGGAAPLRLRARNPSRSHALLLQPVLAAPLPHLALDGDAAPEAFRVAEWRATRGAVRSWGAAGGGGAGGELHNGSALPPLLLAPDAELELKLTFAPARAAHLTAVLYLRNNLTILETVQVAGRGAHPSFELGGRRPGEGGPLLLEVGACEAAARALVVRNTGAVRVRLRGWRVAGAACGARGFELQPCAPLWLAPNESRPLTLSFAADWTLARQAAVLTVRAEPPGAAPAAFALHAAVPAPLLARCAAAAPRPPWEPALRAAGSLLALAALALVLAAAALDAERELRRARAARPPPAPAPRRPLDLRAIADEPQQAPPAAVARRAARRRRAVRAPPAAGDPLAERRAFERWRRGVLHARDDDTERSSEDNEHSPPPPAPPPAPAALPAHPAHAAPPDGYEADPETEERPPDDDAASTDSTSASSSSPTADVDEPDERGHESTGCERAPAAAPRTPPPRPARSPSPPRRASPAARLAPPRHHARKDKLCKRRERPAASPPRSPPRPDPRPGGALRWGESWSSVVAARPPGPAPLAPIGSDVRRRAELAPAAPAAPPDHSLFYFNGDPAPREPEYAWPAPPADRPAFTPPRDFLDTRPGAVWAPVGAAAWLWGGLAEPGVRPPPGFGAPRPVRPYDPFRSLASIWAPGALDWRADSPPPPPPDEARR